MADLFAIGTTALQAFQNAIAVTSNNIANANTPGYSLETINFAAAPPQTDGTIQVGGGVLISGIDRAYSELTTNQLYASQSSLGQLDGLQTYTSQLDNIVGTTAGGLTTALQGYYNAWSTVASNPTSTAARQALLSAANTVAGSLQTTNGQLQQLSTSINTGLKGDVQQINSIATQIAKLNTQIVAGTAAAGGTPPNALLDQRGQLLSDLSKLVGVSTTSNSDGSINVFVGTGTTLVLAQSASALTAVGSPFNASQVEIAPAANPTDIISSTLTGGDVGGLLDARTQVVQPAINQLGQIAGGIYSAANNQQSVGLNLGGTLGSPLFAVGSPQVSGAAGNTGTGTVVASLDSNNAGSLTADNYLLTYTAAGYTLTDSTTGAAVALTGNGTAASPYSAAGITFTVSGTPAVGDQFQIQPTANLAGSLSVALTSTSQIAASAALQASPGTATGNTNTGTGTISAPVVNAANPSASILTPVTIAFQSPTAYTINGTAPQPPNPATYPAAGATITYNGWTATISGAPAANDRFTIGPAASGNNANALANAAQQTQGLLQGGTVSLNAAVASLVTGIGSQALQTNTAQTAQAAINTQAQAAQQSVSGVNLDQEAANLLKYQQAYQASAQALAIGNQLFTTLIDSVNGTYS